MYYKNIYAELTQLGEYFPYKEEAIGSRPIFCTRSNENWFDSGLLLLKNTTRKDMLCWTKWLSWRPLKSQIRVQFPYRVFVKKKKGNNHHEKAKTEISKTKVIMRL